MAKKQNEAEEGVHIEESLNSVETFFEENQNLVMGILGAVILIVAAFVIYTRYVITPKAMEANKQVYKAQQWFETDSFQLALEGDGNYYGFYDIIDDYRSTPVGKMARYYAGICNLNLGNYDEAIDYLSKFKTSDPNIQAIAYGGIGDSHAQLDDMDQAVKYYEKAAKTSNIGSVAPLYYIRAGKAYEVLDDLDAAGKMYKAIVNDYPGTSSFNDAEKNLTRIEALLN